MTKDRLQSPEPTPRHPELVSWSISPLSQAVIGGRWMLSRQAIEDKRVQHDGSYWRSASDWRQSQINRQINPLRVFGFNQIYLPWPVPVLQLLFTCDCRGHVTEHFKTDQAIDRVFRRMTGRQFVSMLIQALKQVRGYADIESTVGLAREYIDARVFRLSHGRYMGVRWTLKQVQGDGWGTNGRY